MRFSFILIIIFSFLSSGQAQQKYWSISFESGVSQIPSFTSGVSFENPKLGFSTSLGASYSSPINKTLSVVVGIGLSQLQSGESGEGFFREGTAEPKGYGEGKLKNNILFATLPIYLVVKSNKWELAMGPESLFLLHGWSHSKADFTYNFGGNSFSWDKWQSGNTRYLFYNLAITGKVSIQIKERLNVYYKYSQSLFDAFSYRRSQLAKQTIWRMALGVEMKIK